MSAWEIHTCSIGIFGRLVKRGSVGSRGANCTGIGFAPKAMHFSSPPEIDFPPPAIQFLPSSEIGFHHR